MTGAPPYNSQSPPQQPPSYPIYTSPSKNHHPYYPGNDQYQQHPPQTPPAFPPHSALSRSPHYAHATPSMPATLPPLNGDPASAAAASAAQYHGHSSGPTPFSLPRPYSGSILSGNSASPYGHTTPSHAHPSTLPDNHSQSPPKKEADSPYSMIGNGPPPGYTMMREPPPRPASPPKEAVRVIFLSFLSALQ